MSSSSFLAQSKVILASIVFLYACFHIYYVNWQSWFDDVPLMRGAADFHEDFETNREESNLGKHQFDVTQPETKVGGRKFLTIWPTIPVPNFKGADTRIMDTIMALQLEGFAIDLAHFESFADEKKDPNYDDSEDKRLLKEAGVQTVFGPGVDAFDGMDAKSYYGVVFWLWDNPAYLHYLQVLIPRLLLDNPIMKVVVVNDDKGIALRRLTGSFPKASNTDLCNWILAHRPSWLQGSDHHHEVSSLGNVDKHFTNILEQEMHLLSLAHMVVGIDDSVADFMKLMVPAKTAATLRYVFPEPKNVRGSGFSERSGYLFVGYLNTANIAGMKWFLEETLALVNPLHKFHLVGLVVKALPEVCKCDKSGSKCTSKNPLVICHGSVSAEKLLELMLSVRVAINPALEPAGVATKACRALVVGTPVVSTDYDGTFARRPFDSVANVAKICTHRDADCFAKSINQFLEEEDTWLSYSKNGPEYVRNNYGIHNVIQGWRTIMEGLDNEKSKVVVVGNAVRTGESMPSQTWHIVKALTSEFEVVVLGTLEPGIPGVKRFDSGTDMLTGFQANVVFRQGWPPALDHVSSQYCGPSCRVATLLPWEFGTIPKDWVAKLLESSDELWGPSLYNANVHVNSGFPPSRVKVVSCGLDCEGLRQVSESTPEDAKKDKTEFLFSGGLLPRKGVDILLTLWNEAFCSNDSPFRSKVHLTLHTSYELGFSKEQLDNMVQIVSSCGNIEWIRGKWMEKDQYYSMLLRADVYISPFRSEGFGLPQVEAMFFGKPFIGPVGGTAADDYLTSTTGYPVPAQKDVCRMPPCKDSGLCVMPPCGSHGCQCLDLVSPPSWFEVDRVLFRKAMIQAAGNIQEVKRKGVAARKLVEDEFCWNKVSLKLVESFRELSSSAIKRSKEKVENLEPLRPIRPERRSLGEIIFLVACSLLLVIGLVYKKKHRLLGLIGLSHEN